MKIKEFNELPQKLADGELSQKEVIDLLCSFVNQNCPLFGLQKYDEDLRQEILLGIIEKGIHIISVYIIANIFGKHVILQVHVYKEKCRISPLKVANVGKGSGGTYSSYFESR